jgi:ribosomal protein S18 acetylase RimI-like enzyme
MWRAATPADDDTIVSMCLALNVDDPGIVAVTPEQVRRTLAKLREEPVRGRAVVCETEHCVVGYALLISLWSNELGGEVVHIDELFVEHNSRGRGLATDLIENLAGGERSGLAALVLEVSPHNERAKILYERLGFRGRNITLVRAIRAT